MRHNLLIVDDEELIRQGLRARILYLNIKANEIYEAKSGAGAIEITETYPVDIVITDIRMPDMDGLTLIRELKKSGKNMKFIILSGYAEFSYATTAIRLGVNAYLLKPLSNEELKKTFDKLYQKMAEESQIKNALWMQKKMGREKSEYDMEKRLNSLLLDSSDAISGVKSLAKTCQIDSSEIDTDTFLTLGAIHINSETYDNAAFRQIDHDLICFSIRNVFREIKASCRKQIVNSLSDKNRLYAFFFMKNPEKLRNEVEHIFVQMHAVLEKRMGIYLTMGIGRTVHSIDQTLAQESEGALRQRIIYGNSNLYFYEDIGIFSEKNFPVSQVQVLSSYLEKNEIHKIKQLLREIFSEDLLHKYGMPYVRIMWVRILNVILQYYEKKERDASSMEKLLMSFDLPNQIESIPEIRQRIIDIIMDCVHEEMISDLDARSKISMAVAYISEHYSEDLAITDLATRYGMSANYFSSVFKTETSESPVNYITDLRMKRAQELLKDTTLSVADIARRVGYEDSQYFFRVFKKHTGVTPLSFREKTNGRLFR